MLPTIQLLPRLCPWGRSISTILSACEISFCLISKIVLMVIRDIIVVFLKMWEVRILFLLFSPFDLIVKSRGAMGLASLL
ncbi:hypothetical protein [Bartonella sp. CL266QHHD]|uniref:hypothetical protein n=1 Tax=Bartonella sp. CL266QHHD TaxID=3243519 RepID=UPI0035D0CCBD